MENNQVDTPKSKTKKIVLFSLGTLTLGTLAFFGFKHFTKSKNENNDTTDQTNDDLDSEKNFQTTANNKPRTGLPSPGNGDAFPLRLGSKGNKVRSLQQALIRTFGAGILPKYGADGWLGTEVQSVLRSKGYGFPLQESDFLKITGEKKEEAQKPLVIFDPASIAKGIYSAITAKDFTATNILLKSIKNTTDYSLVSEQLKNNYRIDRVRQTLVNAVLSTFTESSQKLKVQEAFKGMGLKYKGSKWSLSGLNGTQKAVQLITTKKCVIYKNGTQKNLGMSIPKDVVIGSKVGSYKGNTFFKLFDTNQQFHVANDCVEPLSADGSLSGTKSGKPKEGDVVSVAKQVLATTQKSEVVILPPGLLLGIISLLHGDLATIDTGTELKVKIQFLKKH